MSEKDAASYCGVASRSFRSHVPVPPIRIGGRNLWDIKCLDKWLDRQSGLENDDRPVTEGEAYEERQARRARGAA